MEKNRVKPDEIECCVDCLMWYGTGEEQSPEHAKRLEEYESGIISLFHIEPENPSFTWNGKCEMCGTTVGGDRFKGYVRFSREMYQ